MPLRSVLRFVTTPSPMYNNVTNLLPLERRRMLSRDFTIRIGVVILVFVTGLTIIAAILLIPTYLFLDTSTSVKEARLANMDSTLSSGDEAALLARLSALSSNTAKLTALADAPSASATISEILAISHPGVSLSGFVYTPSVGNSPTTLIISGSATTRDSLRNYQVTLQGTSFISSATLPVSAYASDTNISFAITVTFAP